MVKIRYLYTYFKPKKQSPSLHFLHERTTLINIGQNKSPRLLWLKYETYIKSHLGYVSTKKTHLFQTQKIITKFTFYPRENYTNNYKPKKNHRAYVMIRI